jgi:ABC-type glutathione transport system ATPase component
MAEERLLQTYKKPELDRNKGPLLRTDNLVLHYRTSAGVVQAVDGVNFDVGYNEAIVIVGESGCGKSSLSKAILRLLPRNVHAYSGDVYLGGENVMKLDDDQFRQEVRWVKIAMVPQSAMTSLNPVLKVGDQVAEPMISHFGLDRDKAMDQARRMFQHVGVVDFLDRYAFEPSGGMRQRDTGDVAGDAARPDHPR